MVDGCSGFADDATGDGAGLLTSGGGGGGEAGGSGAKDGREGKGGRGGGRDGEGGGGGDASSGLRLFLSGNTSVEGSRANSSSLALSGVV